MLLHFAFVEKFSFAFMKKWLCLLVFVGFTSLMSAQCQGPLTPFTAGEVIRMDVYYHWGPLWLRAARVELSTKVSAVSGKKTWELLATGHTLPSYDWFFRVRDTFRATVLQEGFVPLKAIRKTSEGRFESYGLYEFDPHSGKVAIVSKTSKRPYEKKNYPQQGCTFDLLSGAYFARTFDYRQIKPGEKIPISLVVDNQIYHVSFSFEGSEIIALRDGSRRKAWKFTAPTLEGTVFRGNETITVWTTDDGSNLPLKVEARILVGSVQAFAVP